MGGTITAIQNTDGKLVITGNETKTINVAPALLALINSALQAGDNVSDLTNDAGYLTTTDLSIVGITGSYNDLVDVPTTFAPSAHTHTISEVTNLQTSLNTKVDENAPIVGATHTKITYDDKGLVTGGVDATTADIADSTNRRYVTDADLIDINNLSGVNSGNQTSIVGITGTKAQFNTAVTDGDILYVGDITQYTDELAQDAVGNILTDTATIDFTYNDGLNTISADVKANSITSIELVDNINTSTFLNDGEDGVNPFITAQDLPTLTGYVPYTGATTDVDLGEYQLKAGQLELDQTPTGAFSTAKIRWNDTAGTAEMRLKGDNVTLQIGQELVKRVVNKTATNITLQEVNYQVVRIIGATGQRLSVDLAQADSEANSASTLGLVTENIANNQEGFITFSGEINLINTTGSLQGETWVDGNVLYLSPTIAGQLTNIEPIAPDRKIRVGYVQHTHATQGKIHVDVDRGYSLENLHNVKITATTAGKVLGSTTEGLWENKTIPDALGFTPENITNKTDSYTTSSSTAYVSGKALVEGLGTKANDNSVVHLAGNETISGQKSFSLTGKIDMQTNNGFPAITATVLGSINGQSAAEFINNSSSTYSTALRLRTSSSGGVGNMALNVSNQSPIGTGIVSIASNGGVSISSESGNGDSYISNITFGGTGRNYVGRNNGTETYSVDKTGNVLGNSYIKRSTPANNILLAGGGDLAQGTAFNKNFGLNTGDVVGATTLLNQYATTPIDWTATTFASGQVVFYAGKQWIAKMATVAGDVPYVSIKWEEITFEALANKTTTVDQTIIDGSTNAVSSNAVFDGLALKSNIGHTHVASQITDLSKASVGLGNVDNTSDLSKPLSTATINALATKAPISSVHNPVTIGTANGLSLSTQQLSLGLASSGVTGALSGTDWNIFNAKFNTPTGLTTNYLPKWDGSGFGNSTVSDNGNDFFSIVKNRNTVTGLSIDNVDATINEGVKLSLRYQGTETASFRSFFTGGDFSTEIKSSSYIKFTVSNLEKLRITSGRILINKTDDDLINQLQVAGTISASPATTANQVVVKSQLDAVAARPYKVYTALYSQYGTSNPTVVILENTLGTVTFTRSSTGVYSVNSSGLFTADKTFVIMGAGINANYTNGINLINSSTFSIVTKVSSTQADADSVNTKVAFEIRVYN